MPSVSVPFALDNSPTMFAAFFFFLPYFFMAWLVIFNESSGKILALYFVWIISDGRHGKQQNSKQNNDEFFHYVSP